MVVRNYFDSHLDCENLLALCFIAIFRTTNIHKWDRCYLATAIVVIDFSIYFSLQYFQYFYCVKSNFHVYLLKYSITVNNAKVNTAAATIANVVSYWAIKIHSLVWHWECNCYSSRLNQISNSAISISDYSMHDLLGITIAAKRICCFLVQYVLFKIIDEQHYFSNKDLKSLWRVIVDDVDYL